MLTVRAPKLHSSVEQVDRDGALCIWLLGGYHVSVGQRTVGEGEWRLRKAKNLVKLLALDPGHRLHREQVMETLWPDLDPQAAANNLRKALHIARRALETASPDASRYLLLDEDLLVLCPSAPLWIDVETFEAASVQAQRSHPSVALGIQAYHEALSLYAGDLLPEDQYEDWVVRRREDLRRTYQDLLVGLAQLHENQGELEPAIEALRRAVASDPLHEEAHVGLMRLLALSGKRHQALRQYRQLEETLRRELDVEPAAESRRLHKQIAEGLFPTPDGTSIQRIPAPSPGLPPAPSHNLPGQLTSFVGREREIAEVNRLLRNARLLTLTGPGGCGKTRLAIEVSASLTSDYSDGVWFVELAALSDPALVPHAVASVLGLCEQPGRTPMETLADHLQSKRMLLLLDNCEHLVEACAQLAEVLLRSCPHIKMLATSREALNIPGEIVWLVPPLSLPEPWHLPPPESLSRYEAVRLFVERVGTVLPDFKLADHNASAVAQICHRLDGMPLAIELTAAWAKVLSVEQIAARLDESFQLLAGRAPLGRRTALPRQRTLRAAIDWSYDLLGEEEKTLFRRLAVFAGGFTLEAVEQVCAWGSDEGVGVVAPAVLDLLASLIDKSLVMVMDRPPWEESRYRLLEMLRQYGRERLAELGEAEETERRHAEYYRALAERAEPELHGAQQVAWLERLDREHDNLRAAIDWSQREEAEMGLRIAGSLWWFWDMRGYHSEGRRWLAGLLASANPEPFAARDGKLREGSAAARAKALSSAALLALRQGEASAAEPLLTESLALFKEVGDRLGVANSLERLGTLRYHMGDHAEARRLIEESLALFRALDNKLGIGWALGDLSVLVRIKGDHERARAFLQESLSCLREWGDLRGMAFALNSLGQLMRLEGDYVQAQALLEESLAAARQVGDKPFSGWALQCLGEVARRQGNVAQALSWLAEGIMILRKVGHTRHISQSLYAFGALAVQQGDYERGVRLISAAVALHNQVRASLDADEKAAWDESLASARAVLGEAAFSAAWAEGQAMSLDRAIEYATNRPKAET